MAAYTPQIDVVRIDADGLVLSLPSETIDVYDITTASTVSGYSATTADGIFEGRDASGDGVSVGDVLELSHGTYPEVLQITAKATEEEAIIANPFRYVVEDLRTAETVSTKVDLYAEDRDNPDIPPWIIGSGAPGTTVDILMDQAAVTRNLRIYSVSITKNNWRVSTDFSQLPYQDVTIPPTSERPQQVLATATVSPTAGDAGTAYRLTHASPTFQLPASAGCSVETTVFYLEPTGGNATVQADGADIIEYYADIDLAAGTDDHIGVTQNSYVEIRYVASGKWSIQGTGIFE